MYMRSPYSLLLMLLIFFNESLVHAAVCRSGATDISPQSGEIFSSSFDPGTGQLPWSRVVGAGPAATLTVHTFYETPDSPAGGGVLIRVNNIVVGTTDANGSLTMEHDPFLAHIKAIDPGLSGGTAETVLAAGESQALNVIMTGGESATESAELKIDELDGVLLDKDFNSLTIRFFDIHGSLIPAANLDGVFIDRDEEEPLDLTSFFAVLPSGQVHATDLSSVRSLLGNLPGQIKLRAEASNAQGLIYVGQAGFFLGRHDLQGSFAAPPSAPTLSTSSIRLTANLLGTDVICEAVSDTDGQFLLPRIPGGVYDLSASTESGGKVYTVSSPMTISSDSQAVLSLLTIEDILSGVAPVTLSGTGEPAIPRAIGEINHPPTHLSPARGVSASVFALAGAQNTPVTDSATLSVPAGTERLTLRYLVATAEYPTYVLSQSQFNDSWQARVLAANGAQIFSQQRNVNSQVTISPVWQSDGSTGELIEVVEEFDVSTFTKGGTSFTVVATAMNVGDNLLATTVSANLEVDTTLRINRITPDKINTKGNSKYYSIPRQGARNTFRRSFNLEITKPKDSSIDKVRVDLIRPDGTTEMTVIDESPGSLVEVLDEQNIRIRTTMGGSNPSEVDSTPPNFHNMKYRFTVEASHDGQMLTDQKESSTVHALWRMPDGLSRFGTRDTGGDDWAAKGTYEWINSLATPLPAINDISGEHGRNIGHSTHARGTDVDIYHFTNLLSGQRNGSLNYKELRKKVTQALGGNTSAKTTVKSWFEVARQQLSILTSDGNVARIIFANGRAGSGLPNGWAKQLLLQGKVTSTTNQTLDLGIGSWSNSKVKHNNQHNDHSHIDLNDRVLNSQP